MAFLDSYALLIQCPYCHQQPGSWCRTNFYRPEKQSWTATWLHSGRSDPFREVFAQGYEEGREDGKYFEKRLWDAAIKKGMGSEQAG